MKKFTIWLMYIVTKHNKFVTAREILPGMAVKGTMKLNVETQTIVKDGM